MANEQSNPQASGERARPLILEMLIRTAIGVTVGVLLAGVIHGAIVMLSGA